MKRWIHAATDTAKNIKPGDKVTVYESKTGYSNYDGTFLGQETNKYGVAIGLVKTNHGTEKVSMSSIIPSEKEMFYSLSRDQVLTFDFIKELTHRDDSIWCNKVKYSRTDRDTNMENVVGEDAFIKNCKDNEELFRVVIKTYISKHGSVDRDVIDEWDVPITDALIAEALDIMEHSDEIVVNYAGYQRKFTK